MATAESKNPLERGFAASRFDALDAAAKGFAQPGFAPPQHAKNSAANPAAQNPAPASATQDSAAANLANPAHPAAANPSPASAATRFADSAAQSPSAPPSFSAIPTPYAPILITVYDRLDCLENAIAHLKRNPESKDCHLFIVSDAAYDPAHEGKISEIRRFIAQIQGFKKVDGIFWEENRGSFDSIMSAKRLIFGLYERLIVFEDDILVSRHFLAYMNAALELYRDDPRVISIASHTHYKAIAYKGYPYDCYLARMFSPWGAAFWREKYAKIDYSLQGLDAFLADRDAIRRFNAISPHMLPILNDMLEKRKKYGDVMLCFNMFLHDWLTLYPTKPLSVNRGHDGRGEHCGKDKIWQNQPLCDDFLPQIPPNLALDPKIERRICRAFFSFKRDCLEVALKKLGLYAPTRRVYKAIKGTIYGR